MPRGLSIVIALAAAALAAGAQAPLYVHRAAADDLEIAGQLKDVPAGETRYLRYADLRKLPQETYTVSDDSNLPRGTVIGGVALDTLARLFARAPEEVLIVAICDDGYETHYPRAYLAAHHPVLVLSLNDKPRAQWPQAAGGGSLGPYLISHPFFHPAFRVLSHQDEPQIPYGVVRLEFRRESAVLGAIRPPGKWPADSAVEQGYRIAQQDCFRCHNSGAEGGQKSGKNWLQLAAMARDDPQRFRAIIRNPAQVTPGAKMPGEPDLSDATLDALTRYFRAFAAPRTGARAGASLGEGSQP
jgi:mono/diheme cytochrome c family protein